MQRNPRIVSLLPSATEIVYALGLGDCLVGVTHECDFPADALTKPRLTRSAISPQRREGETAAAAIDREVRENVHAAHSLYGIDAEMLESLWPDVVLTQELCEVCAVSSNLLRKTLAERSIQTEVVSLEPMSLDGVYETIRQVGAATGTEDRAEKEIARMKDRFARIHVAIEDRPRPRTAVLEWTDPPFGAGHWTPELVEIAGGTPVVCNPGAESRMTSWEELDAADPQCIIVAPCGFGVEATLDAIDDLAKTRPEWNALLARTGAHVAALDGNQFVNRPGPRLVETAELFTTAIHPGVLG